jgi:hypothetical protein
MITTTTITIKTKRPVFLCLLSCHNIHIKKATKGTTKINQKISEGALIIIERMLQRYDECTLILSPIKNNPQ